MSKKYSWQKFDIDKQNVLRKAAEEKIEVERHRREMIKKGWRQRREITETIVNPFREAMDKAKNPGVGFAQSWRDRSVKKHQRGNTLNVPKFYYDVSLDGPWLFGETGGPNTYNYHTDECFPHPAWCFSSAFYESELPVLHDFQVRHFQGALVGILRKYKVPLPPD